MSGWTYVNVAEHREVITLNIDHIDIVIGFHITKNAFKPTMWMYEIFLSYCNSKFSAQWLDRQTLLQTFKNQSFTINSKFSAQ